MLTKALPSPQPPPRGPPTACTPHRPAPASRPLPGHGLWPPLAMCSRRTCLKAGIRPPTPMPGPIHSHNVHLPQALPCLDLNSSCSRNASPPALQATGLGTHRVRAALHPRQPPSPPGIGAVPPRPGPRGGAHPTSRQRWEGRPPSRDRIRCGVSPTPRRGNRQGPGTLAGPGRPWPDSAQGGTASSQWSWAPASSLPGGPGSSVSLLCSRAWALPAQ